MDGRFPRASELHGSRVSPGHFTPVDRVPQPGEGGLPEPRKTCGDPEDDAVDALTELLRAPAGALHELVQSTPVLERAPVQDLSQDLVAFKVKGVSVPQRAGPGEYLHWIHG